MSADEFPAWHQALAYAVSGLRLEGLGRQAAPDLTALVLQLEADCLRSATGFGLRHRVPDDLTRGIGPAQLLAATAALRRRLGLDATAADQVIVDRPLSAGERRLVQDAPPHHQG